ncbi:hypothetical protein Mbo2_007 [Rhodococcus phage Mbo2]|uniref:Uncharacterized protein n=1 Tax=Rhodococcus phage Mbo2 TaxID=2936911 RepID=A0A9E7IS94_9CAUD|nr:hypothetical protein Mbo2_007 [Rhodococcus phage Mbo2]
MLAPMDGRATSAFCSATPQPTVANRVGERTDPSALVSIHFYVRLRAPHSLTLF